MSDVTDDQPDAFAASWDGYARQARATGQHWPGDDWGDAQLWQSWFARLFEPSGVRAWRRAVEIGQGTGKYTRLVLEAGPAELLACDVSRTFLDLCAERLAEHVRGQRLHLRHVASNDPTAVEAATRELGWLGRVDAVYSIDTLVHVPFTQIVAYLLQATVMLREGGRFIASFAHGTTDGGRAKLLGDLVRVVRGGGRPETGCFHWIAPELLTSTLSAIGYVVEVCDDDPFHRRDGHLVAILDDPDRAQNARAAAGLGPGTA